MKHQRNKKLSPFVALENEFRATKAWKATSYPARCLYVELKSFYSHKRQNNVYLSVRDAMKALGSKSHCVGRWFLELQHYGFIVKMTDGCLGPDGVGIAPHWRLTEVCNVNNPGPPTRDYLLWDGAKFRPRKTESRPAKRDRVSRQTGHNQNRQNPNFEAEVSRQTGHNNGARCPAKRDILRVTTPRARLGSRGQGEGADRVRTRPIGKVGERVEVVHDGDRCYGYIRQWGEAWQATWSGDRMDDHFIGEFGTKATAIEAVVLRGPHREAA